MAWQPRVALDEGLVAMNDFKLWPDLVRILDSAALLGAESYDIVDGQELVISWMKGMLYC